ncbi:hypothetical protein E2C01_040664 [Portunus trituberculatus]|uniref:Uncharacterized protein n=1 Tax=Portunus trituberculatus TaxID=210409 RepID=A0A5B7FPD5_PORTR|nr:hypothetical protein [Portunus trituberculatus]
MVIIRRVVKRSEFMTGGEGDEAPRAPSSDRCEWQQVGNEGVAVTYQPHPFTHPPTALLVSFSARKQNKVYKVFTWKAQHRGGSNYHNSARKILRGG